MNLKTVIETSLLWHLRRNIDVMAALPITYTEDRVNIGENCGCHEDLVPVVRVVYTGIHSDTVKVWQFPGNISDLMERVEAVL